MGTAARGQLCSGKAMWPTFLARERKSLSSLKISPVTKPDILERVAVKMKLLMGFKCEGENTQTGCAGIWNHGVPQRTLDDFGGE